MVGAINCAFANRCSESRTSVVGSAQRVIVARARAPRDAAVQHCLEYLGSSQPDFELEGSARSVVQFEAVLPESAACIVYALVDLDGQFGVVVDVPPRGIQTRSSGCTCGPLPLRLHMCVCVFFPFILDIKFVGRTSRGHRRKVTQDLSSTFFCGARLNFSREKDSAIAFPLRP